VLCIDDEHNAPDFSRRTQAAPRGGGEEPADETLALPSEVYCNAREPEPRHIVPGEAAANPIRQVGVSQSARGQAVKPKAGLLSELSIARKVFAAPDSGLRRA
jgi:hypothetical protein